jgi:hypothetical protein
MMFNITKPTGSLFCGRNQLEWVDTDLINGFIQAKMGVGIISKGKYFGMPYKTELKLMESYRMG